MNLGGLCNPFTQIHHWSLCKKLFNSSLTWLGYRETKTAQEWGVSDAKIYRERIILAMKSFWRQMRTVKERGPKTSQIWAFILTLAFQTQGVLAKPLLKLYCLQISPVGLFAPWIRQQCLKHLGQGQANNRHIVKDHCHHHYYSVA